MKANFRFSHYKSMETLSCHSNQSAYATAIENNIFVEANAMNISAKFQPEPPYSFWRVNIFQIEPYNYHDNQSNREVRIKSKCLVDHSTNISI